MCSDFIFNLFPLPLSSEKKDLRVFGDFFPPPTNLCSGALYFTLQLILISFMIRGRLDLQNSGTSFMMSCIPSMKAGWHFLQCSLFSCLFFGFVSFTDRFTDKPHWMPTTPLWGKKSTWELSCCTSCQAVMSCPIAYSTVGGSKQKN